MFEKTLSKPDKKPVKKRNNDFLIMFSKVKKHGSESINLSINAEVCQKAKLYKGDKIEILVDVKAKKIRIERCNEGVTLCKLSETTFRTTYAVKVGRLTTKAERVLIDQVKTGTGFIEFDMPEEIHKKRNSKQKVKK